MSDLIRETCCNCGIEFAMPKKYKSALVENHKGFYCPNGHEQYYDGETDAEKYKRHYENTKKRAENAEWYREHYKKSASSYKGHYTRLKNSTPKQKAEIVQLIKKGE